VEKHSEMGVGLPTPGPISSLIRHEHLTFLMIHGPMIIPASKLHSALSILSMSYGDGDASNSTLS
jgi:hypothetical protein